MPAESRHNRGKLSPVSHQFKLLQFANHSAHLVTKKSSSLTHFPHIFQNVHRMTRSHCIGLVWLKVCLRDEHDVIFTNAVSC